MTVEEFKKLTGDEQKEWLEKQTGELDRPVADICQELGITRAQLQGLGTLMLSISGATSLLKIAPV